MGPLVGFSQFLPLIVQARLCDPDDPSRETRQPTPCSHWAAGAKGKGAAAHHDRPPNATSATEFVSLSPSKTRDVMVHVGCIRGGPLRDHGRADTQHQRCREADGEGVGEAISSSPGPAALVPTAQPSLLARTARTYLYKCLCAVVQRPAHGQLGGDGDKTGMRPLARACRAPSIMCLVICMRGRVQSATLRAHTRSLICSPSRPWSGGASTVHVVSSVATPQHHSVLPR